MVCHSGRTNLYSNWSNIRINSVLKLHRQEQIYTMISPKSHMSLTEMSYDLIEILKFPSGSVCPCAPHPFSLIEGDHHKVICIISIFNQVFIKPAPAVLQCHTHDFHFDYDLLRHWYVCTGYRRHELTY